MSTKVTYVCDLCGAQQDTNRQFWNVKVHASCAEVRREEHYYDSPAKQVECCRKCLEEKLGLHVSEKTRQIDGYKEPTIEDLVRQIVLRAMP